VDCTSLRVCPYPYRGHLLPTAVLAMQLPIAHIIGICAYVFGFLCIVNALDVPAGVQAHGEQDVLLRTQSQKAALETIHRRSVKKRLGTVVEKGYTPEDPNLGWGIGVRVPASSTLSVGTLNF
jgi:hypothetical protein